MLNVTMSKNLNGTSVIDGNVVATMYATIQENGNVSINKNVVNNDLYIKNKVSIRQDMFDFEQEAYKQQDNTEVTVNDEVTE